MHLNDTYKFYSTDNIQWKEPQQVPHNKNQQNFLLVFHEVTAPAVNIAAVQLPCSWYSVTSAGQMLTDVRAWPHVPTKAQGVLTT